MTTSPTSRTTLVWQVTDCRRARWCAPPNRSATPLPTEDARRPGCPGPSTVRRGDRGRRGRGGQEYVVSVAVSLEDVDDSTAALVPPLLVGLPLVLLLVGGTTWVVATRALAPVERIRREVEQITG